YARLVELDVLSDLENDIRADAVVHVATANDIVSRKTNDGISLSATGTKNLLEYAVKNQIPNFIFFSTFQVYGTELAGTITESSPTLAVNDYGLNHLFGEMYVEMYARQGRINGVSVRPSNVHGPFLLPSIDRWTLVPGCFCKEVIEKQTITIRSSGKQMRNFIHLENLSAAVHCILNNFKPGYDIVNAGSSENMSMLGVAKLVKAVYESLGGKTVNLIVEGDQPTTANIFDVSLEKLKNKYGFTENKEANLVRTIKSQFLFLEKANKPNPV
ncbi:MAG TPA: SDR family oxidoreductase, partial [Pyrinomonadaceae bacterium]